MWECVEKDAAFSVYHCVHINGITIQKVSWYLDFILNFGESSLCERGSSNP